MNWFIFLVLSFIGTSMDSNQELNTPIIVVADASIMFMDIPDEYYIILREGQEYRITTEARLSLEDPLEIVADISIGGVGLLKIKYVESKGSGYFRYNILRYGNEITFVPMGYVRDYLDLNDLEGSIIRNRYEIVGTIVRNAFGDEVYKRFKDVTILEVYRVGISRME